MAYIGNTLNNQNFIAAIDYFSGNGSTTSFTLSRPVAAAAQVQVVIDNVPQHPTDAFSVNGNTITFTSAPLSGTNNIYVYYTSPNTQVATIPANPTVQGNMSIITGRLTFGVSSQVKIGPNAGLTNQDSLAIAMGEVAGQLNQGFAGIAIGAEAGEENQQGAAVAIGVQAGQYTQGGDAIAIGTVAGNGNQGADAIAIGSSAGASNQGANAIAIGNRAGIFTSHANSIILNATGSNLNSPAASTFTVKPVRATPSTSNLAAYDSSTGEVSYASSAYVTSNGGLAFGGTTNYGTSGQVLQSNGDAAPSWTTISTSAFAAGTRLAFQQTAAPTGWTKDTTAALDDSIMRIVTGSASSGGSTAFSTFNGQTSVGATTLSTTQIPSHTHNSATGTPVQGNSGSGLVAALAVVGNSGATGGGGSHTHSITTSIKYYDFIIASKN